MRSDAGRVVAELRTPRLRGREEEQAELDRLLARAAKGPGAGVLLTGEPGIGRTAMLSTAAALARRSGTQVLSAAGKQLERRMAFSVIAQCLGIHPAAADPQRATAVEILYARRRGTNTAGYPRPGMAAVQALIHLVEELCAQGPLALLLDDLQWADPASLLVLHRLSLAWHDLPLFVLGAHRPDHDGTGLAPLRRSLGTEGWSELRLGGLDPDTIACVIAHHLGARPGPGLLRLAEAAAGNPSYLVDLWTALRTDGWIERRDGRAEVVAPGVPPSLTETVTRRLDFLSDPALHALQAATVLGVRFAAADWSTLLGVPAQQLLGLVHEAQQSGVLHHDGNLLTFQHGLIRQVLYQSMPDTLRSMLRAGMDRLTTPAGAVDEAAAAPPCDVPRRLPFWPVPVPAPDGGDAVPTVSDPFRRPAPTDRSRPMRAQALYALGLQRALEADFVEAIRLLQQALRLTPEKTHPTQWLGIRLTMATCFADMDGTDECVRLLGATHRQAAEAGGVFLPWFHMANAVCHFVAGRWDDALAQVGAGLREDASSLSGALNGLAALIALHRDQHVQAVTHLEAAARAPAQSTSALLWPPDLLPWCATALLHEMRGETQQAFDALRQLWDQGEDPLHETPVLTFLAPELLRLALAHGDTGYARQVLNRAEYQAQRTGAVCHRGDAHHSRGLFDGDPALILRAAESYRSAPRPLKEAYAYTDAAELLGRAGRIKDASLLLRKALDIYDGLGATWDRNRAVQRLHTAGIRRAFRGRDRRPAKGWDALTATELRIAALVAEGCTNPEISARMVRSRNTVQTHVSSILRKLDLTSRVEIAAEYTRRNQEYLPGRTGQVTDVRSGIYGAE
ncbi:AAA family ATPase [Streptomyces sp. NPDC048637]|uniref:ATP-binding protein n=1 Tax=Streptomyces sp. NPDC048637 TaxID=3155636 RepID=UPI003423F450